MKTNEEVIKIMTEVGLKPRSVAEMMGIGYQSFIHKKTEYNGKYFNRRNLENFKVELRERVLKLI